jgi:DNA-binding IclR family transcriptional regulator
LARPTLYRLLSTLERTGLVRAFGNPVRYELGHKVLQLADLWLDGKDIVRVGRPFLEELWLATEETVGLMVPLSPTRRLCVLELRSPHPLGFAYGFGHTAVTYRGASGKVLLAHLAGSDLQPVLNEASSSASVNVARLLDELKVIREKGYAVTSAEVTEGTVAVAAPIFDRTGAIAGAISLYGPAVRLARPKWASVGRMVRGAAAKVSKALGYTERRRRINEG